MQQDVYRRLRQHLDRMPVPFPETESGVELRILEQLFTPEDAELVLELSAMPEPIKTIRKRLRGHGSADDLAARLHKMAGNGLIQELPSKKGPLYGKAPFVVGIYEGQLKRLTREFETDARRYIDHEFGQALHSAKTPQMRTIPVGRSVETRREVAAYDDIRRFVETTPGPFAVMDCICRKGKDLVGEPCGQTGIRENCLTFGAAAEMMTARGTGRFVSREEMLGKLDEADREGLVLQPQNTQDPLFVCSCCGCCCGVLTTAKKLPRPADHFQTSYRAEADATLCGACGTCVTRCQMDAVTVNEHAHVDEARCIGCGLCATTCPSDAMKLTEARHERTPPKDTPALYATMFKDRYGAWGVAKAVAQHTLGRKV